MHFKRQKRERLTLDMTSLIDVVFLLLIFFMVTTTFTDKTELVVALPEAEGAIQMEAKDAIEVIVDQKGEYSVNGQRLINNNFSTLKSAISKIASNDTRRPFLITADANSPHQAVVRVMDAAGQLGLVNLSITTIRPSE